MVTDYTIKFVNDDFDPGTLLFKREAKINKHNREEVMQGYTDTVYSWSLQRFVRRHTDDDLLFFQYGASDAAGELEADKVLHELNTDYCFDFDYEPGEKDILFIRHHYRNPEIKGKFRPSITDGHLLFLFNGKEWERDSHVLHIYENICRGTVTIIQI